jgi:putative ATPase
MRPLVPSHPRGLEGKIAEKLAHLKKLDEEAGKG